MKPGPNQPSFFEGESPVAVQSKAGPPTRNADTKAAGDYEYQKAFARRVGALPKHDLGSEAQMVSYIRGSVWTVQELYRAAEATGLDTLNDGRDVVQDGQMRYQRRVRNCLQHLKKKGLAKPLGNGTWLFEDEPESRESSTFSMAGAGRGQLLILGQPSRIGAMVADGATAMKQLEFEQQMFYMDGPWDLEVDQSSQNPSAWDQARDDQFALSGYREKPADKTYRQFLTDLIAPTFPIVTDGGYAVLVGGPQQSALMQVVAEEVGFTYVNKIAVRRPFAPRTTKRLAHSHIDVVVLTKGPLANRKRYFAELDDLPRSASGLTYNRDWWGDVPKLEQPGEVKNKNELPPLLPDRLVRMLTRPRDSILEVCAGGFGMAEAAALHDRSYLGIDLNPKAVNLGMARLLRLVDKTVSGQLVPGCGGLDLEAMLGPLTPSEASRRIPINRSEALSF